jgi:hypothetical protein
VRREKVERHIAPVIAFGGIELLHRKQFHNCDAEFLEIGYLLDYSRICTPFLLSNSRVIARREAFDVHLVYDRVVSVAGPAIFAPIEGRPGGWEDT